MDGQSGEIDEMIAAYEHEQESQPPDGVGSLGNSTDGKLQPLGDSTNTISVSAAYQGFRITYLFAPIWNMWEFWKWKIYLI